MNRGKKRQADSNDSMKISPLHLGRGAGGGVDINCDLGEGAGNDEYIMPFISSANIACGWHAGDAATMKQTIDLCMKHQVAIGAHPSFYDRENFGRTEMELPVQGVYELVTKQLVVLHEIAVSLGAAMQHVKPHGALYIMSAKEALLARVIAGAVKDFDSHLVLFGLSGSHSITEAKKLGLKTASEVFADRTYQDDGSLTPRSESNALINETEKAVTQVLQMIQQGTVTTVSGKTVPILAETICIHGDNKHAVEFAKAIHELLKKENSNQ